MQERPAYNINLEKTDNDTEERDKMRNRTDLNGDGNWTTRRQTNSPTDQLADKSNSRN